MGQYKSEGTLDASASKPTTVTAEAKKIQSVESTVKQLQENFGILQQEIARLHRDISRLKGDISDIVTMIKSRG